MRRRNWLIVGAASALAIAGLVVLASLWRHPGAFEDAGGWAAGNEHAEVGEPLYVGMSYENGDGGGSITIHGVVPHIVSDTAGAAVTFFVCTVDPDVVGAVGVVGDDEIRQECAEIAPADGATMGLNATPRQQVVMAVTLGHAGRVEIDGIDIDYSHGWQSGTQHTGGEVVVATPSS